MWPRFLLSAMRSTLRCGNASTWRLRRFWMSILVWCWEGFQPLQLQVWWSNLLHGRLLILLKYRRRSGRQFGKVFGVFRSQTCGDIKKAEDGRLKGVRLKAGVGLFEPFSLDPFGLQPFNLGLWYKAACVPFQSPSCRCIL